MAITVIVHVVGAEPFVAEIEDLPNPLAQIVTCTNPRQRNGKPVSYVEADATRVIFPWHRISFLETLPGEEDHDEVETFFRD
ncbi:MAG: hypothetical protein KDF65_00870 [Anaerolineae bacterium]|nr:hypothetical protein [Anaerolineae bacterium]